ncbi:MAG: endonuclease/exonuclease/phosphatase family protein [Patulibacter sp.]
MRVLVWNLFHGRAQPPAGRPLLQEFADALAGWEWDVALLQEVPPWWPPLLGSHCRADCRTALTSRNQLLPLRRAIASRAPDRLKSNGGGANAILVRAPLTITAHGRRRLRIRPERRVMHAVRLADPHGGPFDGAWIGNVHTQLGHWNDAAGMAAPLADLERSTTQLEAWADDAARGMTTPERGTGRGAGTPKRGLGGIGGADRSPIVLGGDFNLPREAVAANLADDWARIATSGPDHVAGRGVVAASPSVRPERGTLSDHAPLLVALTARR